MYKVTNSHGYPYAIFETLKEAKAGLKHYSDMYHTGHPFKIKKLVEKLVFVENKNVKKR